MQKGFTILEIVIVVAMFAIIAIITMPVILSYFNVQNVDDAAATMIVTLRQARTQAMYQKNDSAFGVKFTTSSYTLFQGSSYESRTLSEDLTTTLPVSITVSGLSDVVFTKRTGIPSTTGTITIQSGDSTRSIQINSQGLIEQL